MRVLVLRLLAAMCLAAALPLACIKYPWMPVTVRETVASYHEPYPDGSASYLADRKRLFVEWHLATGLYVLERYRSSGYGPSRVNGLRGDFSSYSGFLLE